MSAPETGWHRHDSGAVHRDNDDCTWLGNPVPVAPPVAGYVPPPCPECRAGKCVNCVTQTWDDLADQPTVCPCHAAGHPAP